MAHSFVTRMTPAVCDDNQSRRDAISGKYFLLIKRIRQLLIFLILKVWWQYMVGHENESSRSVSSTVEEFDLTNQIEKWIQEHHVMSAVSQDGCQTNRSQVHINREKTSFNEFINNVVLLNSSFPFLFLFGKGTFACKTTHLTIWTNSFELMFFFLAKVYIVVELWKEKLSPCASSIQLKFCKLSLIYFSPFRPIGKTRSNKSGRFTR